MQGKKGTCIRGIWIGAWKGDNASYASIHQWIRRHKPRPEPFVCEDCGKKKNLELASISGLCVRDFDNYKWLCISCHRTRDAARDYQKRHNILASS